MEVRKLSRSELKKLEGNYVFHGSPTLFEEAMPHQATDYGNNPDNEHFAIYGSMELDFSIIFAFEKLPKARNHWRVVHVGGKRVGNKYVGGRCVGELDKNTHIAEDAKGYLYCFDKKHFQPTTEGGRQYVCKYPVAPEIVSEVEYKDYMDLFEVVDFTKDYM